MRECHQCEVVTWHQACWENYSMIPLIFFQVIWKLKGSCDMISGPQKIIALSWGWMDSYLPFSGFVLYDINKLSCHVHCHLSKSSKVSAAEFAIGHNNQKIISEGCRWYWDTLWLVGCVCVWLVWIHSQNILMMWFGDVFNYLSKLLSGSIVEKQ